MARLTSSLFPFVDLLCGRPYYEFMRILWKEPIASALVSMAAVFIGSGIAFFALTTHERFALGLNMIGCVFLLIHGVYRMKYDPAYRASPFDREKRRLP